MALQTSPSVLGPLTTSKERSKHRGRSDSVKHRKRNAPYQRSRPQTRQKDGHRRTSTPKFTSRLRKPPSCRRPLDLERLLCLRLLSRGPLLQRRLIKRMQEQPFGEEKDSKPSASVDVFVATGPLTARNSTKSSWAPSERVFLSCCLPFSF